MAGSSKSVSSIVLLSGGLDSAVVAALEAERGRSVLGLFIDYGQLARRNERRAATHVAQLLGLLLEEIKLRLPLATGLGNRKSDLASSHDAYVRARNLLFLSLAAVRLGHDGGRIAIGATSEDAFVDTKTSYFDSAQPLLGGGEGDAAIEIVAPLATLSKRDVLRLAELYGVPLDITWSCYRSGQRPCGRCLSCQHLAQAVRRDPLAGWFESEEVPTGPVVELDEAIAAARERRERAQEARQQRGPTFLGPLDPPVNRQFSEAERATLKEAADRVAPDQWMDVFLGRDLEGRERLATESARRVYVASREPDHWRRRWVRTSALVTDTALTRSRATRLSIGGSKSSERPNFWLFADGDAATYE